MVCTAQPFLFEGIVVFKCTIHTKWLYFFTVYALQYIATALFCPVQKEDTHEPFPGELPGLQPTFGRAG